MAKTVGTSSPLLTGAQVTPPSLDRVTPSSSPAANSVLSFAKPGDGVSPTSRFAVRPSLAATQVAPPSSERAIPSLGNPATNTARSSSCTQHRLSTGPRASPVDFQVAPPSSDRATPATVAAAMRDVAG